MTMVFHVGIRPYDGKVSYYNEEERRSFDVEISYKVHPFDIEKVDLMYEEIISKINGELGCACIGANHNYNIKIRKEFIESGLKNGFKSVEIINRKTAIYLYAMSQIKYKPLNGNVIWIHWKKNIFVWKMNEQKARYIGQWYAFYLTLEDLEKIINESKLNRGPDIMLCVYKKAYIKKLHDCKCFEYREENNYVSTGALLKAQITSGNRLFAHLLTVNQLSQKITLKIGNNEIKCFNEGEELPIFYNKTFTKTSDINFLEIMPRDSQSKKVILPKKSKFDLFFEIDNNQIYSAYFSENLNEDNSDFWEKSEDWKMKEEQKTGKERIEKATVEKLENDRFEKYRTELELNKQQRENVRLEFDHRFEQKTNGKAEREATERKLQKRYHALETSDGPYKYSGTTPSSHVASSFYEIPKNNVSKNDQIVGIDLGTSRCCVAVNRKNGINTVPLDNNGERLLPSFISYDEKNVKCGKVVLNRLRHFSKSTIFDSKRIIGRKFNDIEMDENWNFAVNHENEKVYLEIIGINGRMKISPEEVASDLLKYIKLKTEEFQGQKLSKAVITIPAAFTEAQKAATLKAAKLAGWESVTLLPEPIAAAFAYFVDRPIPNNSNVLLFDLGGGTLDVCIFEVQNDQIQILCNTGDSKLGGRNFDTVLINYFKNILNTKHGISALKDKKYKLMLECQRIKEDLSTGLDSSLDIDDFDTNKQGIISIRREEFQRMTQSLLNKIQNTIKSALFETKMEPNQIYKVLHVEGGSRMPMIKELLQNIFSEAEHCIEEHSDEVVAIGAAYYACNCFAE